MAKKTININQPQDFINVGSAPNSKDGDSLRAAFARLNDAIDNIDSNFSELYTAVGQPVDGNLRTDIVGSVFADDSSVIVDSIDSKVTADTVTGGAIRITGSTIDTVDSSSIVIDQAVSLTSNVTVGGDILPETANGGNLGSSAKPWRSLYVSNNTIYIGGNALKIDGNGDLTLNNNRIVQENGEFLVLDNLTDVSASSPSVGDVLSWNGGSWVNAGQATVPTLTSQLTNDSGFLTSVGNIRSESDVSIEINLTDSTMRVWRFGEDGELTFPDGTSQSSAGISASSTNTLTNKTINIQAGQGNVFQIQGNSITSYSGSGAVLALTSMPTFSGLNVNNSSLSIDGGTGSYYAKPTFADGTGTIHKAGVYKSANDANNALFTFGANGAGTMSVVMDGSLFIGSALPSNNGGLNTNYGGWLVVQAGAKFGGDLNTLGNFILDTPGNYVRFGDGTMQTTAADFGYLDLDKDTIKGTAGYQYTFATDGYFTSSTSSESTNYFFVTYNTTNTNIAAGWTVVGGTANTTVSSVTYPVAGYPGVIRVNLTAAASSTSGFYPVTVTSPDRLRVEIQPNPGTNDKFTFTTSGLTFPDGSLALTDSVLNNGLDADIKGSVFADDSTIMVNAIDNTLHAFSVNTLGINLLNSADGILGPMGGYVLIGTSDGAGGSNTIATFDGSGIVFDQDVNMGAGTKIQSYTGDNLVLVSATGMGDFTWTFNAGGGLEMPGSLIFNEGYLYGDNNDHLHLMGEEDHYVKISSNNGAKSWWFNLDGSLTVPGDIKSEGNINIDINLSDSTLRRWQFGEDGYLTFPDSTVQTTAFTGNAATVDITNTNGIDTNYSITFVESRNATQYLRADVDLTFNSATNLLTAGNVAIKQTLTGGINDGSDFIITSQPNPNRNNASNIGIYPGLASGTASEAGFVSITGGGSDVIGLAGGDVYLRGGPHTNGGTNGTIRVESILKIDDGVHEKFQALADATGTVTHDCSSGHVFYHTSPDANWTANFTNLNLSSTYATAVTLIIVQGGTGYYPNVVQISGVGQTINWQGNATPTPSSNRVDVVTFSIINNSGTYTVLGQLTGF